MESLGSSRIYAIIVTYNGMQWIERCLKSIKDSSIDIYPIIIDNGSSDGTVDYIKENFNDIHILDNSNNLGFGKANNIAIKVALDLGATHFLLINQDVYINSDTIEKLLSFDDNNSLLSSIHLDGSGNNFDINFLANSILKVNDYSNVSLTDYIKIMRDAVIEVPFVNAAFWLLPRKIVEIVGGFNPLFYHYGEDNNYVSRVTYHKFAVKIVLSTFIRHDRKQFGNKKLFDSNLFYRMILLENLNINHNLFALMRVNFIFFIRIFYYIFTFKFYKASNILNGFQKLFLNSNKVYRSRKEEKKIKSNWI